MARHVAICGGLALLAYVAPASAIDNPSPLGGLKRCRAIVASDERLKCFDTVSAQIEQAVETKEITVLDRDGIRETKRALFGFSLPEAGIFNRKDEPDFTQIDTTVESVTGVAYDKYELALSGGSRWRTTGSMRSIPRPGDKIRIRKAALGSYFISINGDRGVKGLRIR